MPTIGKCWPSLLMILVFLGVDGDANAQLYAPAAAPKTPRATPSPSMVMAISIFPNEVQLQGSHDAAQLIVTAKLANGRLQDLTHAVDFAIADPSLIEVSQQGRVTPRADGQTQLTARFGEHHALLKVTTHSVHENLPINFGNQIVPIFTKLTCNSGGCHGKASGQNGFKLSLLGFDAPADFESLVKESRGRRLMPAAPDHSLLLRKAIGAVPHGGGKKMDRDSDEYKLIRRWIAAGLPFGKPDDPVVTKITVYPEHRILQRDSQQQFAVYAHYNDGTREDITRRAQYESNDQEIAIVNESALVRTLDMSGEAAIMARYQGHVAVFRATVPLDGPTPAYAFPHATLVDQHTHQKWQQLGLVPSERCSDEAFLRRASIDITGTLPTPNQVQAFVADKDPDKRDKLVDRLLETEEHAYYFANKWADILKVKRGNRPERAMGTFGFHDWIREAIAEDMPYDQFARDILAASGDERTHPPTVWYKELSKPEEFVDDTAQVFLGLRMACANCHHHPYEKWSQDDYWGLAAFFSRVGRKKMTVPGLVQGRPREVELVYARSGGSVANKRTGKPAPFKPLDQDPLQVGVGADPRHLLVDWMTAADNPFFAKAVANRYWAHFFGRGIVDPLDDMRVTNPPSNPALLEALAHTLVDHRYSLKHLIRVICKSRTYQLSAVPNAFNSHDKQNYARYYPKRLSAEVLLDAVNQVTKSRAGFGNLPADRYAPNRAIMLFDESFGSYFLDVFGRPQRISACECERVSEANLAQSLHLLNSNEVQSKLSQGGGRADLLAKDPRPEREKLEELFLWVYGRRPSPTDLKVALEHIDEHRKNKKLAYENILWALLNTKEFVFNR